MPVRSEIKLSLIFDVTTPLTPREQAILLDAFQKVQELRQARGITGGDIAQLEQKILAMPVRAVRSLRPTADQEEIVIREAIAASLNLTRAAERLDTSLKTLHTRIRRYGIDWRAIVATSVPSEPEASTTQ